MTDKIETQDSLYNRDEVLSQIDELLKIEDEKERYEKTSKFVSDRLKLLTESSTPREFSAHSQPRKGFLHPESKVEINAIVDPIMIDDPAIYTLLIDTFARYKRSPGWQDKSLRELTPETVLTVINSYFGNDWSDGETAEIRKRFYLDRSGLDSEPLHLNELKGKGFGSCAEKAATAQNLISFLGFQSELVTSSKCRLISEEADDPDGHLYNVITSGNSYLIFDPTNPRFIWSSPNNVHSIRPAFYRIDSEQYKSLMDGGQVKVTHNDFNMEGSEAVLGQDQVRIYGGSFKAAIT